MHRMKKTVFALLAVFVLLFAHARAEDYDYPASVTFGSFLFDLVDIYENGGDIRRIDADAGELGDDLAFAIAEHWKRVYLDPDYKLYLHGKDDPAAIPIRGPHAIVVLGYELKDGNMTPELKGRCEAAAALAEAFPESVLVLSGGATGKNNPRGNTEAGRMRNYLVDRCNVDPARIFTDTRAKDTVSNAENTLAILEAQGIGSMTLVTSSYHQRWGQAVYNAVAVLYAMEHGWKVNIVGNFCYETQPSVAAYYWDARIAVRQLGTLIGLPDSQMALLPLPKQHK